MYSESDLEAAVASGALSRDAVDAFRRHVAAQRATPAADEESFRLLSGFNDIFVAIAIALLLTALAWIAGEVHAGLGGLAVAVASWFLAEYFTRARRMALPSILLLLAFVGGIAASLIGTMAELEPNISERASALVGSGIAAAAAAAAWFHWRRFMVPITVAAGCIAIVAIVVALTAAAVPALEENVLWVVLAGGLGLFATAMWWDRSDRARQTRRADVAFWLHLAAAPMIAQPVFHLLGVMDGDVATSQAIVVIALYVCFALVSLAVDRRALLVSSLAFVLYAMSALFEKFGAVSLSVAFTALVIGSALLMLSAFWQQARRIVVSPLPEHWQGQLPAIGASASPQQA